MFRRGLHTGWHYGFAAVVSRDFFTVWDPYGSWFQEIRWYAGCILASPFGQIHKKLEGR